jgi:hypothetical protein
MIEQQQVVLVVIKKHLSVLSLSISLQSSPHLLLIRMVAEPQVLHLESVEWKKGLTHPHTRPFLDPFPHYVHRKEGKSETINYDAQRMVGHGSFGAVFQAKVVETNEVVAIKKVLQDRRFKNRELQIMRQLSKQPHPYVVLLKHYFVSKGSKADEVCSLFLMCLRDDPTLRLLLFVLSLSLCLGVLESCVGIYSGDCPLCCEDV